MSKRKKRITLTRVTLALIGVLSLAALWIVWQWNRTPTYWRDNEQFVQQEEAKLRDIADSLEGRVISELSRAGRDGQLSTITISFDEANAWLRSKLPQWAKHEGFAMPKPLRDYMVASDQGKPVIAFVLDTEEITQVISIRLDTHVRDSGKLFLKIDDFKAGSISMSPDSILDHVRNKLPGYYKDMTLLDELVRGIEVEPVFQHPGHTSKNLRLVGVNMTEQGIAVTLEAARRGNLQ